MKTPMRWIYSKKNLQILSIVFIPLGFLVSIKTTSIGVTLLLIVWLINFKELEFKFLLKKSAVHLLFIYFVFLLIGISYSQDIQQALKLVTRHLSFILIPIIFLTIKPLSNNERNFIIKTYVYLVSFFFIICLLNAIYRQVVFFNQGGSFNWYFFYRYDLLEIFIQHPTYVSMCTILSLSFLLNNSKRLFKNNWELVFLMLIQAFSIVLYGSRIGYIILLIVVFLFMYKNLKSKTKKLKAKLGLSYTIAIIILLITFWNIPIVRERIQFTFGYQQEYKFNDKDLIKNGTPEKQGRLLLWEDVYELIKEKPFLGYGTGSSNKILAQKYKEKGHLLFLENKFNAHNTYLELLLVGGVALLLIYLSILLAILYFGIKRKNFVLTSFFLIISITGLTETLFRVQGIVYFSFFFSFLLINKEGHE